mgnify:CR=1 FL=1
MAIGKLIQNIFKKLLDIAFFPDVFTLKVRNDIEILEQAFDC